MLTIVRDTMNALKRENSPGRLKFYANLKDAEGYSPMANLLAFYDVKGKREDSEALRNIEKLIDMGADVNQDLSNGRKPLHIASENGFVSLANVLIRKGADVKAVDFVENTALHTAKNADIVRTLCMYGSDVNAKNKEGETPLHRAMTAEVAEALIQNKADINAKNGKGQTPLDVAAETKNKAVAKAIFSYQQKLDTQKQIADKKQLDEEAKQKAKKAELQRRRLSRGLQ